MPRGTGKTTELIKMSAELKIPILTLSQVSYVCIAKEMGLDIPSQVSPCEAKSLNCGEVLVDDFDSVLQYLIGATPICGTISEE